MDLFASKELKFKPMRRYIWALTVSIILFLVAVSWSLIWRPLGGPPRIPEKIADITRLAFAIDVLLIYALTVRCVDIAATNLEILRPGTPKWWLNTMPMIALFPGLNVLGSFFYLSYLYRKSNSRWRTKAAQYWLEPSVYIRCLAMIVLGYTLISWSRVTPPEEMDGPAYLMPVLLLFIVLFSCLLSIFYQIGRLQQRFYEKLPQLTKQRTCEACGEIYPKEHQNCPVCGNKNSDFA